MVGDALGRYVEGTPHFRFAAGAELLAEGAIANNSRLLLAFVPLWHTGPDGRPRRTGRVSGIRRLPLRDGWRACGQWERISQMVGRKALFSGLMKAVTWGNAIVTGYGFLTRGRRP